MNYPIIPYRIFPLGDSAISIDFGNYINEAINTEVIARFTQFQQHPFPGIIEWVPAYSSLTVYYDLAIAAKNIPAGHTVFEWIKKKLETQLLQPVQQNEKAERIVKVPVCYEEEYALDIQHVSQTKKITIAEIIQLHTSQNYKVYMLGFLPGFAYLGELDDRIAMPRKHQPANITAGSVGIAGKQTGIYPLASPGGWQIIGTTPLKLFDPGNEDPTLFRAGDTVQFYSINQNDFYEIQNSPLHTGRGVGGEG